jgi:hypothetical protein
VSRWHAIRVREDLYRALQAQAARESRSVAGQLDFVLSRALEQETGSSDVEVGTPRDAEGTLAPSPARAPVAQRQTTIDEMLASCPNCAGEMQDYCLDDGRGGGEMVKRCEDCGYVREGT